MNILCIIPSRIGSTRLQRKPLLQIRGKTMIQMVYENASKCTSINEVIVATDSTEIASVIHQLGGNAIISDKLFETGSDRVANTAKQFKNIDVVVNLQGDEPFVTPTMLDKLLSPYINGLNPEMATLARPLDHANFNNPGVVKVLTDLNHNAIYFSRSPIPYYRTQVEAPVFHHIGLYAFQYDFLQTFTALSQTPLEKTESLEQLRALEHGYKIKVSITCEKTLEINTPEEFELAQQFDFST